MGRVMLPVSIISRRLDSKELSSRWYNLNGSNPNDMKVVARFAYRFHLWATLEATMYSSDVGGGNLRFVVLEAAKVYEQIAFECCLFLQEYCFHSVLWRLDMVVVRFHCPFVSLSGCHDGSGNGLTKTSLITHLRDRHCNGDAQAITRQSMSTNLVVFEEAEGIPGGSLQLVREALAKPSPSWSNIDEESLDLGERNVRQCKRKICDDHYNAAVRVLSSSGVAPYNDATLQDLKAKHPLKFAPSLPLIPIDHHQLIASPSVVLDMIKSFPRGTSCGCDVVNLFLDGKCPKILGEYIASAPLTSLVKPGGGIRPIVVGMVWRRLVSKVSATMIGHSLNGYLNDLQLGVGVSGGGEAIRHVVNRLIEGRGDDAGLSMLLVDFKNAFNLVDHEVMLQEVRTHFPAISRWVEFCYTNPARLYYGEHALRSCQGVQQGDPLGPLLFALVLHPLVCKIKDSFNLSFEAWYLDDGTIIGDTLVVGEVLKDPRSMFAGVFPPNIARPLHGVKLLGGPVSADFDFCSELVIKRVAKSIELMDVVAKINDPQCELLLLCACAGISKLYFSMRTCSPHVFERTQCSFDVALCSALERIVTAFGPEFGDWQWRLSTLPFSFRGLVSTLQLAPRFLRMIFVDTMLYHVLVLLVSNWHNLVRDTLVDICFRSRISAGKEVDIGLGGERDKPLRLADMLLYSWDGGLDVCVDLTGSSPLTQTGMIDFVPGRAVIEAAQRKRVKYEAKCADIGYGFLPFSFSSFGELESDAVTLLKRI
ncbi:putative reverse transcriptase domain-containing protein [Tanacetum coccineum]